MGLFDTIRLELGIEAYGIADGATFQTSSLYCGLERLTITRNGELIHHCEQHNMDAPRASDTSLAFHGDLLLIAVDDSIQPDRYVARFTHGLLEWFRPSADCPVATEFLLAQSSR